MLPKRYPLPIVAKLLSATPPDARLTYPLLVLKLVLLKLAIPLVAAPAVEAAVASLRLSLLCAIAADELTLELVSKPLIHFEVPLS